MIDYKKIARTIARKQQENIVKCIEKGQCPDLHWSLELAVEDALKYVAKNVREQTKRELHQIIREFDESKEPTNN